MHSSTIITITSYFAISAIAAALPHGPSAAAGGVSPQVKANVTATIYKWLSDIEVVNNFVDTASSSEDPKTISSQAAVAFVAAMDEGASNTILHQEVMLDASGEVAYQALMPKFAIIGPAINDTIYHPENLAKNVAAVNAARCPSKTMVGAIALEGNVQHAAASAVGIKVPLPPTPTACNSAPAQSSAWSSWN